jgi:hypothetical protein
LVENHLGYLERHPSIVIQLVGKNKLGRLCRCTQISIVYINKGDFPTFFKTEFKIPKFILKLFGQDFWNISKQSRRT